MDISHNTTVGKKSTEGMLKGIKLATEAVRLTYGPKGQNAVIENELYPFHEVVNDAQSIIQAIKVKDVSYEEARVVNRGLGFLKELMDKADKDSGDGRKTTCILAEEITERGYNSNVSGLELKRELDSLIPMIEQSINAQKKSISEKEVHKVATIASESEEIGQILGEIYQNIGKDGIIIPEGSNTYTTSISYIEGVRFQGTGYLSPYMVRDETAKKEGRKETEAVYRNPTILVTKRKISHLNDINPLLETLQKQGKKDLVIFTDDMDSTVASIMIKAHQDGVINLLIIKAPTLWKGSIFEDFAKCTGATIVEDASGINFKNLKLEHLGTCGKITVDKDETTIIGISDISDHIAELRKNDDVESKLRLSWLQNKTAILKLGANNESELSYKRLKAKDAINASRLALRDGVVEGGGIALYRVSQSLPDTTAGNILKEALQAPIKQLCLNSGIEIPETFGENVIDASAVTKNAARNAIALAGIVLTAGIVITIPPKSAEELALIGSTMKANQMRF